MKTDYCQSLPAHCQNFQSFAQEARVNSSSSLFNKDTNCLKVPSSDWMFELIHRGRTGFIPQLCQLLSRDKGSMFASLHNGQKQIYVLP